MFTFAADCVNSQTFSRPSPAFTTAQGRFTNHSEPSANKFIFAHPIHRR